MVDVVGDSVEEADEGKTRDGQVWSDLKDTHALASQCLLSERTPFTVAPLLQSAATDFL